MNDDALKQKIRQAVLGKVHSGAARMRPRFYFALRAAASIALALVALFISALVLSFIAFSIHESGEQFLLGFGARGLSTLFMLFPWVPLAVDIMAIMALEWLLSGFRFGYRISILSLFGIVFGTSFALAAALYLSPLHGSLLDRADRGALPLLGEIYEGIHDSHIDRGIFRGTVMQVLPDRIVIGHNDGDRDSDEGLRTVLLPPGESQGYAVGEHVYILGTSTGQGIEPYGMERFGDER